MIVAWIVVGLTGAMILAHMARPRMEDRRLTSAQFFHDLPQVREGFPKLRIASPLTSRAFLLRLLSLVLLLLAVLAFEGKLAPQFSRRVIGVWLLVDTSASMSTEQNGISRQEVARMVAMEALGKTRRVDPDVQRCWRLSAFDMEVRELVSGTSSISDVETRLAKLTTRPLGTDLRLVQREVTRTLRVAQADESCPITHIVVITDMPRPDWLAALEGPRIIWRDIGNSVANVGFVALRPARDQLLGNVQEVEIDMRAYNTRPDNVTLHIIRPNGLQELRKAVWEDSGLWRVPLLPSEPGLYQLQLEPGDAYRYDNRAAFQIPVTSTLKVDWRLSLDDWPALLGWILDAVTPDIRITSSAQEVGTVPSVLLGRGYRSPDSVPVRVGYFYESSPLLADLNLDVVETYTLPTVNLPEGYQPVLGYQDDKVWRVWLAQRNDPPSALVPGLPVASDDDLGRFSTIVFYNAVRWLLRERPPPEIYTLTSPQAPQPTGSRLVLHEGEGDTTRPNVSSDNLDSIAPAPRPGIGEPLWPLFVFAAVLFYAIERLLAFRGGPLWR